MLAQVGIDGEAEGRGVVAGLDVRGELDLRLQPGQELRRAQDVAQRLGLLTADPLRALDEGRPAIDPGRTVVIGRRAEQHRPLPVAAQVALRRGQSPDLLLELAALHVDETARRRREQQRDQADEGGQTEGHPRVGGELATGQPGRARSPGYAVPRAHRISSR